MIINLLLAEIYFLALLLLLLLLSEKAGKKEGTRKEAGWKSCYKMELLENMED